jgi:NADPH:quinone reductase-like Zn-dependent oxidoreductase
MIATGFFRAAQEYRFPAVLGRDVAGTVEAAGPGVTRLGVGDRVYGFVKRPYIGDGTFAEHLVVGQDLGVAAAPKGLPLSAAGALGQSGVTALECVDAVLTGHDDVVLVNGATGGVGTYAVQIAVALGARVVATARTPQQAELLRSLGAEHVVDWTGGDLADAVREVVPGGVSGLVDLVKRVDSAVMGEGEEEARVAFAGLARSVLRPGGRASSVTNGGDPDLLGPVPCANVHSTPTPESLLRLAQLVDEGFVRPVVSATYAFDDIAAAFERLATGGTPGKIAVVLVDEDVA